MLADAPCLRNGHGACFVTVTGQILMAAYSHRVTLLSGALPRRLVVVSSGPHMPC
jgi:hypothetical protein